MTIRLTPLRIAGLALLLSTCASTVALAADPGVAALLRQAEYWRSKGREDLAQQALQRARAIAPDDAEVRGAVSAPPPRQAPRAAPAPAPKSQTRAPAAARPAAPAQRQAAAPAPATARGGTARVAGYDALDDGDLARAGAQFERALSVNRRDPDALGGLGLVRLRQSRFGEAFGLLDQASRLGRADQWAQPLAAARYYAGIAEARGLVARGNLKQAQGIAEDLVRSGYGEPAPALELLGDIYERQGRFADSAELYRQAGQGGGQDETRLALRAARGRALAAAANGDDMGAEREFQAGLVLDQSDPWIRYEFARFMIKRNRLSEAESLARSLAQIGSADALYAAALVNADLKRPVEAERLLDMIPAGQRTAPMATFAMGVKTDSAVQRALQLAKAGHGAEGAASLRQLAAVRGMPAARLAAIANALFDMGDTAGAAATAQAALDAPVSGIDDYDALVRVLARTGRDDLARAALQKAGAMAAGTPDGQRSYGRMSAALAVAQADRARLAGRFAEGFDVLQGAWAAAPDDVDVMAALARLYQSGAMPARAAQTFQLVLVRKPGDRDALLGLAGSAQAAGDRDLSQKAQAEALRAFPDDYEVYMALAQVEQARGNDGAAVKLLKKARSLYAQRQQGPGAVLGGNPFAAQDAGGMANPFRAAPVAAPTVNPFALGSGTRLPAAQAVPQYAYNQAPPAYPGSYAGAPAAAPMMPAPYGQPAPAAPAWPGEAYPAPAYGAPAYGAPPAGEPASSPQYSGDPVLDQLQSQIVSLSQDTGTRVDVSTSYRNRGGEAGLGSLDEIQGSAKISTGVAGGRVYASAGATVIDAGTPTGSGLARFGRNGTIEAQSIVDKVKSPLVLADAQHDSGVSFAVGYESDIVQVEAGTTPVGIGETKLTFKAAVTPQLGNGVAAKAFVERKPVTDSVVSYAGTRDPVTGERWGQVMRTAAGGGLSYDHDGSGVYGEGRYYRFNGTNVQDNSGFEANVGGYLRAWKGEHASLTTGINVNYQSYEHSQNYFTFGNGGYFSPQNFIGIGFPVRYAMNTDRLDLSAAVTPGFQSYSEEASALYPTDPAAQAVLNALKAENSDVRSQYDTFSKTGFALSAETSLYYRVSPNTRIGGEISYNSFGSYKEVRSGLGLRQSFGGGK